MIRPLRGRVIIRPTGDSGGYAHEFQRLGLVLPDTAVFDPRQQKNQNSLGRGVVVAMGPPMLTKKGVEVPAGFAVGDEVIHIGQHVSRLHTWEDGTIVRACSQEEVCGVVEPDPLPTRSVPSTLPAPPSDDEFERLMNRAFADTDPPPEFGTEGLAE